MSEKKLLLIDGSSLAFRAFYSILDLDRFKNQSGLHTNALFSFNRMLDNVLKQFEPTHILVAFDQSGPTFRSELFSDYKGGRQKTPSEFQEQMPYFRVLLDGYGIPYYSVAEYEADDIIGTLSRQVEAEDQVVVISGDKDLIQLASDNVDVYITRKGVSDLVAYTTDSIREMYDLTPEQIIDMKGLMGDSSDNYPGVTRIGEKTALKLLHQFGSVENLYDQIDELKPSKMKENLVNEEDQARLSKRLARILTDAPIDLSLDELHFKGKDPEALADFYRQMNFNSFLSHLQEEFGLEGLAIEDQALDSIDLYPVESLESLDGISLPERAALYLETLEENYHFADIVGVAIADLDQEKAYFLAGDQAFESEAFCDWLADSSKSKISYDSKRDRVLASRQGVHLAGIRFDVLIADYLLDSHHSGQLAEMLETYGLPSLVQFDEAVYGKGAKMKLPSEDVLASHLASKTQSLAILEEPLMEALEESQMKSLYEEMEFPLAEVLAKMEILGIKVDGETLEERNQVLIERLGEMEAEIFELAGQAFNLNSPKQLGVVLFEDLGLPVIKKTKTGYSTAAGVLEKLLDKHPIIQKILDYRQVAKLQGTYLAGLPEYIQEDGRIHTRFIQTLTQTGRLSSADPNLQNIPTRMEEGRRIRQAFIPSQDHWKLFSADYSQIELRVLAHISGDPHMIQAFQDGEDIHAATARRVFGIPKDQEIDSNIRRQAKAVNFGIVYGISDYGLSQNLNIPRYEAKEFIDTYFEKYPGVSQYMEEVVKEAKSKGYVETLFNRRRYLPDLKSSNFNVRSFAERTAINSPIQGTAADIIKIAMIRLDRAIQEAGLEARLLLQVHDELILEAPDSEMETLSDLVVEIMESAVELQVPIEVEYNQGNTWYDL
ncbi:DNA polymerase I [Hutsoniella sourekii]|uniref:DNA polymerase I n=1 Tax=Hutsoniella sourekii TaxID=87650 RepID=UPI000482CF80|nr:DNA polymerase I [Hutsoniella sourekii]